MIVIKVENLEFLVNSNLTALEACKYVGIDVPRFCYHEMLSVAGNCRMCLVEVEKSVKPVASCALPIGNNMQLYVNSPQVKKARHNVLENLLFNHPLDCPICDQGGECDLQDQVKLFGGEFSRSFQNKRGVEDKECGPLIKTIMTRCIHCTRCVRFGSEIAGINFLGTLNRGGSTEIGGYIQEISNSEISGTVIDLCPVGALTSKKYAFKARPWEIRSNEGVDLTDSSGSNIYVNFKESEIIRILPKNNSGINESLISDKARFSFDSIKSQRLQQNFRKSTANGNTIFEKTDWKIIFEQLDLLLDNDKPVLILINEELDFESLSILKGISNNSGGNVRVKSITGTNVGENNLFLNIYNDQIKDLEKESKICFLVSTNLRLESCVLNTKIRNKYLNSKLKVLGAGLEFKSSFPTEFCNLSLSKTLEVLEGTNFFFSKALISFKNPIMLFGNSFHRRVYDVTPLFAFLKKIVPTIKIIDIKSSCNTSGAELLNIKAVNTGDFLNSEAILAIGLDDTTFVRRHLLNYGRPIFWFNAHRSELSEKVATYLIPIAAPFEEEGIFFNLEYRPQKNLKTLSVINDARSVRSVAKALTNKQRNTVLGRSFDYIKELVETSKLFVSMKNRMLSAENTKGFNIFSSSLISFHPFKSSVENFYTTNGFTKHSSTMVDCSKEVIKKSTNF